MNTLHLGIYTMLESKLQKLIVVIGHGYLYLLHNCHFHYLCQCGTVVNNGQ